jgi:hypothetical protein
MNSKTSLLASIVLALPLALSLQAGSCGKDAHSRAASGTHDNRSANRNDPAPASTANGNDARAGGDGGREVKPNMQQPDEARGAAKDARRVGEGIWGGEHIRLEVRAGGAEVEYDCGRGTVGEMALDAEGRFDARGTHTPERGGPVRLGREARGLPARYTGRVEGKTMTLNVTLTGTDEDLGTFTLTRGAPPELVKCR